MPAMVLTADPDRDVAVHLDRLRGLPFVRDVRIAWETGRGEHDVDALVTLRTARRTFKLGLEVKRTFLDRGATSGLIAEHLRLQREHRLPLLLAARYVPRPTGERLADAGVNFVDRAGNIHLKLGEDHNVLLLGRRDAHPAPIARRPSPALIQLLFVLLADPASAGWPVRALAEAAGIGRTAAATARQRLVAEKVLQLQRGAYHLVDRKRLADQFVDGYNRILRSHLVIGHFRAPERSPDLLLEHFGRLAKRAELAWAVTGGHAAYVLQHFYRDDQVPVFTTTLPSELQRELRLVPDPVGPVVLLLAFSSYCAWRQVGDIWVAHPWLVYAELVHRGEPRALEAADQLREEYLER
jgi:hypothetical protein